MVIVNKVRPWNAPSNTTIACRFVCLRAILTAFLDRLGTAVEEHHLFW